MSFEDTELLVTLTVGEIGYILCNLEDKYGQLLDGEIPEQVQTIFSKLEGCLLYTSPSPRDSDQSRMPSSA